MFAHRVGVQREIAFVMAIEINSTETTKFKWYKFDGELGFYFYIFISSLIDKLLKLIQQKH